jgi:(p)ppGpp synthase/HD superfamily hydrolase
MTHVAHSIEKAKTLARLMHAGQVDKAGEDYFAHLVRVAEAGEFYVDVVVGYLHDIIEDTAMTHEDLAAFGFGDYVGTAVEALTHRKGETYADYMARIVAAGGSAARVKAADLRDHLRDTSPIPDSLIKRYTKALALVA